MISVKEGGQPLAGVPGIANPHQEGSDVTMDVGSGTYVFSYPAETLASKLSQGTPYTVDDTVDDLLAQPKTHAVLEKFAPAFVSGSTTQFKGLSMRVASESMPLRFPADTLNSIDKELGNIRR